MAACSYASTFRRARSILPLVVAVAVLAGACAGSPTAGQPDASGASSAVSQPWDGLTGAEREHLLLEEAKKEGKLSVYSGYNDEPAMAEAFTKKYGIQVDVYNANSETVLQRILQEGSAGRSLNDVLILPTPDIDAAQDEGLLATYDSEYRAVISDKGKGDQWTGVRRLAFVAGWNANAVSGKDVPDDFSGFADPSWKGRISLELSDFDWYSTLHDYYLKEGKSEQDVQQMFQAIAANSLTAKGHTVQGQLLAAGQFDVALSLYTQTVERLEDKGAPVTYGADDGEIVEPVVSPGRTSGCVTPRSSSWTPMPSSKSEGTCRRSTKSSFERAKQSAEQAGRIPSAT
jgi:iron(III) transport system substrate-binding protein